MSSNYASAFPHSSESGTAPGISKRLLIEKDIVCALIRSNKKMSQDEIVDYAKSTANKLMKREYNEL